jgi:acid phosphatase (class A)
MTNSVPGRLIRWIGDWNQARSEDKGGWPCEGGNGRNVMRSTCGISNSPLAVVFAAALAIVSSAAQARYVEPSQVDLVDILAPPPTPQSATGKADIEAVLAAQAARTDADVKAAQADDQTSVFRFADVMGAGFTPENLPFAAAFFNDIGGDLNRAIGPVKDRYNRPRPVVEDSHIQPVVRAANASFPSGTATFAFGTAILLANMVPEKASAIFARADAYAHYRVVAGVHYPTDVEGGRISASVIDHVLLHDAVFMADFGKARAEVRRAIGLQ